MENTSNTHENGNNANTVLGCVFCHGTGMVKTFAFDDKRIPDGSYTLNELIDKYGEYVPCCEGCKVMN